MAAPPVDGELFADRQSIATHVERVAAEISSDHPDGVVLVGVLKAAAVLMADLARNLSVPCRIEFLAITPFDGETTRTRVVKDLDRSVRGEAVVLVAGIVDTGLTDDFLHRHLLSEEPASVATAALLDKRAHRLLPIEPRYRVFEAPDSYFVGYGLDIRGRHRNLPDLWSLPAASLEV